MLPPNKCQSLAKTLTSKFWYSAEICHQNFGAGSEPKSKSCTGPNRYLVQPCHKLALPSKFVHLVSGNDDMYLPVGHAHMGVPWLRARTSSPEQCTLSKEGTASMH